MKPATLSFIQTMLTRLFACALIGAGVWYALAEIAQKMNFSIGDPLRLLASFGFALTCWYAAARAEDFVRNFHYVPPQAVPDDGANDEEDYDS